MGLGGDFRSSLGSKKRIYTIVCMGLYPKTI
nr:MAG TPA: hypothetical protein [Caudoviricetes sp.]